MYDFPLSQEGIESWKDPSVTVLSRWSRFKHHLAYTLPVHHKPFSANLYVSLAYLQVSTRRPSLSVKEQPGSPPPPKDIRVRTPHMTKHKGIDDTGGGAVATIWPPEVACLAGVCAVATDTTAALNPLLLCKWATGKGSVQHCQTRLL